VVEIDALAIGNLKLKKTKMD